MQCNIPKQRTSTLRKVVRKPLISLCARSAGGVARKVRKVSCKLLIWLCARLRTVCARCVPHTPHSAPTGARSWDGAPRGAWGSENFLRVAQQHRMPHD